MSQLDNICGIYRASQIRNLMKLYDKLGISYSIEDLAKNSKQELRHLISLAHEKLNGDLQ